MRAVRAIRSEEDYRAALARIEVLMDADPGSADGEELDVLADLVQHYEDHWIPVAYPTPAAAIEFRLEQAGLSQADLVPLIGSVSQVTEVLSGRQPLTMSMARALHRHLGVPAAVLLQWPDPASPEALQGERR
jgi:HTH-type transcriptional regulator/antitoxin HigA